MNTIRIINNQITTAARHLDNTILSADYLQSQLNTKLEKITYEIESMISNQDLVGTALNHLNQRGFIPVSLDKYEVELIHNEACIKVKLEFTCTKAV